MMKLYIFEGVNWLTQNYHDGGGAVVITDGDPIEVLDQEREKNKWHPDDEMQPLEVFDDFITVLETDATEEKVYIFPNAGCC